MANNFGVWLKGMLYLLVSYIHCVLKFSNSLVCGKWVWQICLLRCTKYGLYKWPTVCKHFQMYVDHVLWYLIASQSHFDKAWHIRKFLLARLAKFCIIQCKLYMVYKIRLQKSTCHTGRFTFCRWSGSGICWNHSHLMIHIGICERINFWV